MRSRDIRFQRISHVKQLVQATTCPFHSDLKRPWIWLFDPDILCVDGEVKTISESEVLRVVVAVRQQTEFETWGKGIKHGHDILIGFDVIVPMLQVYFI